jgi:hypothetical protein
MPNTQSSILDVVFAGALQTLREYCVMPRVVNTDFANVPAGQGDTVNVRVPLAQAVTDVSPNQGPVTPVDNTYEKRTVTLDRWRKAGFYLTDKERGELAGAQIPMQMGESIKALANDINSHILSQYKKVWSSVGAPGTAVFDGTTWNAATTTLRSALSAMSSQVVPPSDRRFVLHPVSYAGAIGVEGFVLANQRGTTAALNERAIGRALGLDWYEDQAVPGHASTALSAGNLTVNGVNAAGASTVSLAKASNTSPLVAGDIITIASGPAAGQYVVQADISLIVGNTAVSISPPLRGATAGGEAVTLLATQNRVNLAFHRDAFTFASRPLQSDAASDLMRSVADPVSGVALRMEMIRQNKQDYIEFDVLYGATSFRPELAVRICE